MQRGPDRTLTLLAAASLLWIVAIYAAFDSSQGPIGRLLSWSRLDLRGAGLVPWVSYLAFALPWLAWSRSTVRVGRRTRWAGFLGAAICLLVCAGVCRVMIAQVEQRGGMRPDLSSSYLLTELLMLLLAALGLACAPGGLVRALRARPAFAILAGASLALMGWSYALGWQWQWSCRSQFGWGRLLCLGAALGLGFSVGTRVVQAPEDRPIPARSPFGFVVLAVLLLGLGCPGIPLWSIPLGDLGPLDPWFDGLHHGLPNPPATGLFQLLLACHVAARADRARTWARGLALCALLALVLTLPVLRCLPGSLWSALEESPLLVVPVSLALPASVWSGLSVALFALERRGSSEQTT